MSSDNASPGEKLARHWSRLSRWPGGKRLFSAARQESGA
jgi:hypothetical protein